jgi:amino acid transporter
VGYDRYASVAVLLRVPNSDRFLSLVLLAVFALLNMIGIGESAIVAFIIFAIHIAVLSILTVTGFVTLFRSDYSTLLWNWNSTPNRSTGADIFLGFSVAMLGVSGYESSSNYIEEQKPGVFPKTLRNMAVLVGIFNPLLAFLCVALVPYPQAAQGGAPMMAPLMAPIAANMTAFMNNVTAPIGNFTATIQAAAAPVFYSHNMTGTLDVAQAQRILAMLGSAAGGDWLGWLVSVDAIIVLSGSVLTAYVGVTGLVRRMSLDRCLPQFLLQENPWRHTNHWIIIGFFLICTSLYEAVQGDVRTIGGVYTVAFLSVLSLFAIGNLLLKYKRAKLPRDVRAPIVVVVLGGSMVFSALIGNIIIDQSVVLWFAIYFSVTLFVVTVMLTRTRILRWLDKSVIGRCCATWIHRQVAEINRQEMVFFAKDDNLEVLNKAVLYVRDNELTNVFRIVHVYESEDRIPPRLEEYIDLLDKMYPKLKIDLTLVKGIFTPALVHELAHRLDVPKNFMYLTCPSDSFPHKISEFGGVRVITH